MKRLIALAPLWLALAGCAGSNYDIAQRHDALRDYKGADAGFAVASEGAERGGHFDSSGITFRRVGTEELLDFAFAKRGALFTTPEHDFEQGSAVGTVQPKRLPPGDYEAIVAHGEQFSNSGSVRRPLAPGLRFTVKSGETVYLGRYIIGESSYSPILHISEHQSEDMAVARKRLPELPVDRVTAALPERRQF